MSDMVIDFCISDQVIDGYFIYSDLEDIELDDVELVAECDSWCDDDGT